MMKMISISCALGFTIVLAGCQTNSNDGQQLAEDVVQISYLANTNDEGNCTPYYTATTNKDTDGSAANKIYIIRGETEYYLASNQKIGEIPFQVKMYKENQGMPSEGVACQDLHIKITVEKCRYKYPSERSGCPTIDIIGAEAFGGIEIMALE